MCVSLWTILRERDRDPEDGADRHRAGGGQKHPWAVVPADAIEARPWQVGVLVAAAILLLLLRRGVVATLLRRCRRLGCRTRGRTLATLGLR